MSRTLNEGNHKLLGAADCRDAIAAARENDPVTMVRSDKHLSFYDIHGQLLGTLTSRHAIAKRLDAGDSLVHCSVSWKYDARPDHPDGLLSVRVATGDPDDRYVQWCQANTWGKPREPRPVRSYATNIVGESHCQVAIGACREGDAVTLFREIGNPHDPRAIVVRTNVGATIGYIPRTSWLHRVVHEEGGGATATIQNLHPGAHTAVILSLTVAGSLDEVAYQPPPG